MWRSLDGLAGAGGDGIHSNKRVLNTLVDGGTLPKPPPVDAIVVAPLEDLWVRDLLEECWV